MWHYYKDNQAVGPIDIGEVETLIHNNQITRSTSVWHEGMADWKPIMQTELRNLFPQDAPPPITPPPYTPNSPPSDTKGFINWIPALVLYCVVSALSWLIELIELGGDEEASGSLAMIGLPLIILGVVFICMLHYKCWMALPEGFRFTTPGRAVGFLFIPFYNFYWAFVSWPKLSEGLMIWQQSRGMTPVDTKGLALTYAILFVSGLTIGMVPGFGILIGIADVVIFILYYLKVVGAFNEMLAKS
ncbi:MAG: DUF4339 domain-containing protein [Verrucomicrobiota bacterium]